MPEKLLPDRFAKAGSALLRTWAQTWLLRWSLPGKLPVATLVFTLLGSVSAASAGGAKFSPINRDGFLDIVLIGGATANIKWHENLGTVKQ